jgi:ureidoglycolate lyase
MNAQLDVFTIAVENATPDRLAPYGTVLGSLPSIAPLPITFYGGAVEVRKPAEMESDSPLDLTVIKMQPRPFEVEYIERHPGHRQAFIPLGGKPFIALMAPPSAELPEPAAFRAFRFDGSLGFMMFRGVWHEFPFCVQPNTDLIVLLSKDTSRSLRSDNVVEGEAIGPDLEKRNTRVRWRRRVVLGV